MSTGIMIAASQQNDMAQICMIWRLMDSSTDSGFAMPYHGLQQCHATYLTACSRRQHQQPLSVRGLRQRSLPASRRRAGWRRCATSGGWTKCTGGRTSCARSAVGAQRNCLTSIGAFSLEQTCSLKDHACMEVAEWLLHMVSVAAAAHVAAEQLWHHVCWLCVALRY